MKKKTDSDDIQPIRPGLTRETRENQMIDLADRLAEKQLRDGTASSQVIVHYLKLGSTKAKLELEKLRVENELTQAKKESLQSMQHIEELYSNAINAMRRYSGQGGGRSNDEDEYDDY